MSHLQIDDRDWIECYLLDVCRGLPTAHVLPSRAWHSIYSQAKPISEHKKRGRKFTGGRKRPSPESRRNGKPIGRPRTNPKNAFRWRNYRMRQGEIECFMVETPASYDELMKLQPGAMFYADDERIAAAKRDGSLSDRYLREIEQIRKPIIVVLPSRNADRRIRTFCVDEKAYNREKGWHGAGWNPVGEPPKLTLSPSINAEGDYHGFLQNGILSKDTG